MSKKVSVRMEREVGQKLLEALVLGGSPDLASVIADLQKRLAPKVSKRGLPHSVKVRSVESRKQMTEVMVVRRPVGEVKPGDRVVGPGQIQWIVSKRPADQGIRLVMSKKVKGKERRFERVFDGKKLSVIQG